MCVVFSRVVLILAKSQLQIIESCASPQTCLEVLALPLEILGLKKLL